MTQTKINSSQVDITASDIGALSATGGAINGTITFTGIQPITSQDIFKFQRSDASTSVSGLAVVWTGLATSSPGFSFKSSIMVDGSVMGTNFGSAAGVADTIYAKKLNYTPTGEYAHSTDYNISIPKVGGKVAIQSDTEPTANADRLGFIYQYTGADTASLTSGYFYKCVSDGQNPATYSWTRVDVQPSASGYLPLTGGTLTGNLTMQNSKVQLYNSSILGSFWLESASSGYLRIGKSATASNNDLFINTGTVNQRSIAFGNSDGGRIGSTSAKLEYVYTQKLSNGSDIAVPNTAGTMVVADYTGVSQGNVLTLDSNLKPVWAAPSGGGSTSATATLAVNDWSSNTQTVSVTGVTASNNVIVAAAPASQADYTAAGILCTAQGAGTLTFTCTTTPSSAITVNVLIV